MVDFVWSILKHVISCMQKTEEKFANMPLTLSSAARVLNPKTCWSRGTAPVGVEAHQHFFFFLVKWMHSWKNPFLNFKSAQIYTKDGECLWTNVKSIFQHKINHKLKKKIFHSFQLIKYFSCTFDHFWRIFLVKNSMLF